MHWNKKVDHYENGSAYQQELEDRQKNIYRIRSGVGIIKLFMVVSKLVHLSLQATSTQRDIYKQGYEPTIGVDIRNLSHILD